MTVRKNIPDRGSWARFLRENLESWNEHEEMALGDFVSVDGDFFFFFLDCGLGWEAAS